MADEMKIVIPGEGNRIAIPEPDEVKLPDNPIDDPIVEKEVEIDNVKYKLDKDGNALDDKGQIFKSKADIDALSTDPLETEKVEIDGVIYTIDKDGNAIDDNKTIKFTKDQLDKFSEETTTGTIEISNVIKSTAIPIYDSEGNEVKYDNSEKGLTNYITDVHEVAFQEGAIAFQANLLNKFPIINDIVTHLELYGSLKDFTETPDYSKVTIAKDNVSQQESVVTQARILRGDTPQKAAEYVQFLKDGKRLEDEAIAELSYLNGHYSEMRTKQEKELNDRRLAEQKANDEYWGVSVKNNELHPINKVGSVYDTITKGVVKIGDDTFTIPEKIKYTRDGQVKFAGRNEFFNYLYSPLKFNTPDGLVTMTMYDYDLAIQNQTRTVGHDIMDAFKVFTGGDITQLIKQAIRENEVSKIRKLRSVADPDDNAGKKTEPRRIVIKRD